MATRASSGSVLQLHLPERWPDTSVMTDPVFRWARYDGSRVDRGASPLREIKPAAQIIAIAPSSRALFVRAQLASGRAARQEKVLGFAVEEAIGGAPEDVHSFFAGQLEDGMSLIGVVDKTWLKNAIGELDIQGFTPTRFICESELLAARRGGDAKTWTVVKLATGGFLHVGGLETISLDIPSENPTSPPLTLNLALDEHTQDGDSPAVVEVYTGEGMSPPDIARWTHVLALPVNHAGSWRPENFDARPLSRTNLLAAMGGRRTDGESSLGRYKAAAILAAAIIAIHGALSLADWWRLSSEASGLLGGVEERFRKVLPDAKGLTDSSAQMTHMGRTVAGLRRGSGELAADDALNLLGRITPTLAINSLQAKSLKYDKGNLQLDLTVPESETRASLGAKLKAAGVKIQVERVAPGSGGSTIATVRVSAG